MNTILRTIAITVLFCPSTNSQDPHTLTTQPVVITHSEFVSQIRRGATVYLPAASIVRLDQEVYLPSEVTITTDADNPATIVKDSDAAYGLAIQGASITIENVIMDFNMRGVWGEFKAPISFKMPAYTGLVPDQPIEDIIIRDVTFINSSPPDERVSTKDSWGISFAHNNPESLKNIKLLRCRLMAQWIQLTGNGQGIGGIDGLEICHNYIAYGMANSISVSSSTYGNEIKNVLIANNELRNCLNVGVFVGQDGSAVDYDISLDNVVIADNYIEMDRDSGEYPHCIFVRATAECTGLLIARNLFYTFYATGSVRWATLQGSVESPGTYQLQDNLFLGPCSLIVINMIEL